MHFEGRDEAMTPLDVLVHRACCSEGIGTSPQGLSGPRHDHWLTAGSNFEEKKKGFSCTDFQLDGYRKVSREFSTEFSMCP